MKNLLRRYWLPIALVLIGLFVVLAGVGTATIWRPSDRVNLSLPASNQQKLVVSRAGVMDLYASNARITAKSEGKVVIAIGRAENVAGWVASQPHTEITGQASGKEFQTTSQIPNGEAKEHSPLEAGGTDQWVQIEEGTGTATLNWVNREGNWSFLVWAENNNPQVSVSWTRHVGTPLLWPLVIAGSVIIVLGLIIALALNRISAAARKEEAAAAKHREEQEKEGETGQTPVVAPSINSVASPPTRKELREARSRGEETIEVDGVKFPTGLTPVIQVDEGGKPIAPEGYVSPGESPQSSPVESANPQDAPPAVHTLPTVETPIPSEYTMASEDTVKNTVEESTIPADLSTPQVPVSEKNQVDTEGWQPAPLPAEPEPLAPSSSSTDTLESSWDLDFGDPDDDSSWDDEFELAPAQSAEPQTTDAVGSTLPGEQASSNENSAEQPDFNPPSNPQTTPLETSQNQANFRPPVEQLDQQNLEPTYFSDYQTKDFEDPFNFDGPSAFEEDELPENWDSEDPFQQVEQNRPTNSEPSLETTSQQQEGEDNA